jgi:molecular chaperone GrpE
MSENLNNPAESSINNDQNNLVTDNQLNSNENQILVLQNQINELNQKLNDTNDKLLRSLAEIDNVRRRSREDLEKASKYAISNFVSDLVLVTENFFMASENAPKDEINKYPAIQNYTKAIEMTEKELLKVLEKNKVLRIYPLNQDFDHNFHEAIAQIESDAKEGSVVQVIQAGYSIADRLIRPALVGVAKTKL